MSTNGPTWLISDRSSNIRNAKHCVFLQPTVLKRLDRNMGKNGLWLLHYNTKNNLKWIIDLRLKVKAVRLLLGENTRGDLWFGREDFLYLKKGLKSTLTTGSASKLGWWQRLPQNLRVALFAENLKTIIQLAKFSLLFYFIIMYSQS